MTQASAATNTAAVERTTLDRFLAVVPAAVAGLTLLSILLWEASALKSPIIFGDELEWSMISRAIAHTGHGARLGQPTGFRSFFAYLISPWWRLSSTHAAYTAIKYWDTLVMAAAAVPVYLLGRTLVPTRWAAVAALGTLCTSAYFYAPLLLPETLAFPAFCLCAYVSVQALAGRGRPWTVTAVLLSIAVIGVRTQLAMALLALALAAAWLWVVGPRGRRFRSGWSLADHVGAALLLIGAFVVLNRFASPHAQQWSYVTQSFKGRIWHLGLESGSAFAIGLAILPAIGGLASLWVPERRHDAQWRAFAAYFAASIVSFGTYTGVKAAWNSTQVFTRVEERNLIYLGPLFLIGTVIVLSSRRIWLPGVLAATAFVAWLVLGYGYQLDYPYSDSPGYGIATMANRAFYWTQTDIRIAIGVTLVVSLSVLLLKRSARIPRTAASAGVGLALLTAAVWMTAGQVTSARGAQNAAQQSIDHLVHPLNWVDQATHGAGVTYLGQNIQAPLGLWLTEFWNRSIEHVYTLDGSAPGPGPTVTPDLKKPDGTLRVDPGLSYVLADGGVTLAADPIRQHGTLILYRLRSHPWKLRQTVIGRTGDGWFQSYGAYAYFGPDRSGTLSLQIQSTLCPPKAPVQYATIRVGPVALDEQRAPVVRRATYVRRVVVPTCADTVRSRLLSFAVKTPVAVEVRIAPTISPAAYGVNSDTRQLGAQIGFGFKGH